MTRFLQDILRQPDELLRVIDHLNGTERKLLESAADVIRSARHVYVTGIGASWNAALSAGSIFHAGGLPVYMLDAAELLQFSKIPSDATILVLSRSGRSIEIVKLLAKARAAGATVIGVTNFEDGPLAKEAEIPLVIPVKADHGISVNTYSALAVAAASIASAAVSSFDEDIAAALSSTVAETAKSITEWRDLLADTSWLLPGVPYYFMARGSSLASAYEAGLLWEEGAKLPATAMGTGSFRHGPQEVMMKDVRIAIWIDGEQMRDQDLAVAHDLRDLGASVMLTGHDLPKDAADLIFQLPRSPVHWQFLTDVIPAQLAAERLAQLAGVDCDSFRFASYIVEDDYGLQTGGSTSSTRMESKVSET
ncbi:SIS domain-containing protein [Alloacidobacterium dinghuense]|uniref:Glutamine--fructose-6-phosphate aminotransferase [isomerizing] n=1 Tax=Alloacidobacterium dinghuense TaxID=2763107 RepID=A0A7G8BJJ7_9BACT|nr:SIS domain-containing protein [Alloacidobacterium dinghuense]QNI32717.1 SIS domain-containing protein [Alloacidobacterium dinghuense]